MAADDKISDARQLVLSPLGPARFTTVERGPRRLLSVVASFFILATWCVGIIAVSRLARSWREAEAEADLDAGSGSPFAGTPEPVAPRTGRSARAREGRPTEAATALTKSPPRHERERPEIPDLPEHPERPQRRGMVA